jgi:uncharacterized protein
LSLRLFIFLGILFLLDIYTYWGVRSITYKYDSSKYWRTGYLIIILFTYIGLAYLFLYFSKRPLHAGVVKNLLIGFFFSFLVFKLLFSLFLAIDDLLRVISYLFKFISNFLTSKAPVIYPSRRKFIGQIGMGVAAIPFLSMLYGITKGKYNYKVKALKLKFKNLPKSFDGFKVVHISDIHAGSFDSLEDVQRGIDLINKQNADIICFTGDLVNNDSREIEPFIDSFKTLKGTYGAFSILGNHDYGDYKKWPSKQAKKDNLELLYKHHKSIGFNLLNNKSATIKKGSDEIAILGVENWGKPPFPQRGDLDKALEENTDIDFKILLSHDPTHWDYKVLKHPVNINLTLSGHTHGMQFGVEIPGFKWSPIKYFYPRWAGLYKQASQYLYVNRGFGFLGFPGRVGIWPEITVIELFGDD